MSDKPAKTTKNITASLPHQTALKLKLYAVQNDINISKAVELALGISKMLDGISLPEVKEVTEDVAK